MKSKMRFYSFWYLLAAGLLLTACEKNTPSSVENDDATLSNEEFVTNTKDTTFTDAVLIAYSDESVVITNPFVGNGIDITVTGSDVVVNSTLTDKEINYVLSGKTNNGMFKLYGQYKFNLVLNGVSLINDDGPAINIQSGKKVSVHVITDTNNRLLDAKDYAASDEDQKACFFSEGQLNFYGEGKLTVVGKYKHGICSDDYILVHYGNIVVSEAVSDGVHANDYFAMKAGSLKISSSGDGVECDKGYIKISGGELIIQSGDDGIVASYEGDDTDIHPFIEITGGQLVVNTTGDKAHAIASKDYVSIDSQGTILLSVKGKGAKGVKTGGNFSLLKGDLDIVTTGSAFYDTEEADISAPAGINSDGDFSLSGGTLLISSTGSGAKGITVDGNLLVSSGELQVKATGSEYKYGSVSSEAKGIKADKAITINGGTIAIEAADDGLKSETSVTINDGLLTISKSTEGIEAPLITLKGGTITVFSTDDCLNATYGTGSESNDGSMLVIEGGFVSLDTSNGDGIDSNGGVHMTGGTVVVQGPQSQPEVAIDVNGSFTISGGVLVASGPDSGRMIEATSTSSEQYTVLLKISNQIQAGTFVSIQDASGNNLVTYAPTRRAYYLVYSSPELKAGQSYKLVTGGTHSGGTNSNGLHIGGSVSGGTPKASFTVSSKLTTISV